MSIKVNSVAELKATREQSNKGDFLTDADYVLRDKKAELKDVDKYSANTRDITNDSSRYADELARVKAEARKEVEAEMMSSTFISDLTAKIKAEIEAGAKKPTGGK